jgi:hypothetical protein
LYRYEIHLPTCYNNGAAVEEEKFLTTRSELQARFGGLTANGPVIGWWQDGRIEYEDQQYIFTVDTPAPDRSFWAEYAEQLRRRFEQEVLYVVCYQVEPVHAVALKPQQAALSP